VSRRRRSARGARLLARLLGPVLGLWAVAGCQDLGQVATLDARSPVALSFGPLSIDPPDAEVAALLEPRDVRRALLVQGVPRSRIDEVEREVGDLRRIDEVHVIEPFEPAGRALLSDLILDGVADDVFEELREAIDDEGLDALELRETAARFPAWGGWLVDPEAPDESLHRALTSRPMIVDLRIRVTSFRDLLADDLDGDDLATLDDFIALDSLRTLALRELGVRTLFPEEIEPDGGFPDGEAEEAVERRLIERRTVGPCGPEQQVLAHPLTLSGDILDDAVSRRPLLAADLDPPAGRCGLRAPPESPVDLRDHYDTPTDLELTSELTLEDGAVHLGGYVRAEIAARLSLPGSVGELSDLGEDDDGDR